MDTIIAIQCVSINNVMSEPLHYVLNPCCHGYYQRFESINDAAFSIAFSIPNYSCMSWINAYINSFAFLIALYHAYLFYVAMDTITNSSV